MRPNEFSLEYKLLDNDVLFKNGDAYKSISRLYKDINDMYPSKFRGAIIYSEEVFRRNLEKTKNILSKYFNDNYLIVWAVKSAAIKELVKIAASERINFDVGSLEELTLTKNFAPGKAIYHTAPGKYDWDIEAIIENDVTAISDNLVELKLLNNLAGVYKKKVTVGIRINPSISSSTQQEISTGSLNCKFGIPEISDTFYNELHTLSNLDVKVLHMHIGSQISDPVDYEMAIKSMVRVYRKFLREGYSIKILDFGGGYPFLYSESIGLYDTESTDKHVFSNYCEYGFEEYISRIHQLLKQVLDNETPCIAIEPGRHLTAGTAFALGYVLHTKEYPNGVRWISSSISVNDLWHKQLIPDTYYETHVISKSKQNEKQVPSAIGGTLCFSGDILSPIGKALMLNSNIQRGDIILYKNVGAYSVLGSGNFHNIPRIPILLIDSESKIIEIRNQEIPYFEDHS